MLTKLHNLAIFLLAVISHGTPPWLWRRAWREMEVLHEAEVRKMIWELKKQGRIYEDKDGRLYPKK